MPEHPESEAIASQLLEMKYAAEDLSGSSHQNAPDLVARYASYLQEEPLAGLLAERLPQVDFTTWYEAALNSKGGMSGSGKLTWPRKSPERVAMQAALLERIASKEIVLVGFTMDFTNCGYNSLSGHIEEFLQRIVAPFHRDLLEILKPDLEGEPTSEPFLEGLIAEEDLPKTLGKWHVGEFLGEGAQARAFVVTSHAPEFQGEYVAKVLRPWNAELKTASEEVHRGRFVHEVGLLRGLNTAGCPGIVELVDANDGDENPDFLFYVMPMYAGPLRSPKKPHAFIEEFAGNLDRVLEVADQVLETLEFMHERYDPDDPIIHRDVHTANVFLDAEGQAYLGDFGLARGPREPGSTVWGTAIGEEFGPWRWRPPELTQGSSDKGVPKSDVYMVGGLIYELLSGGEYIDDVEPEVGVFGHESAAKDLCRSFPDDMRLPHLNRVLQHVLVRDVSRRTTAAKLREALRRVRDYTSSMPSPVLFPASDTLEAALSERIARDPTIALNEERVKLQRYLEGVRDQIEATLGTPRESKVTRVLRIHPVGELDEVLHREVNEAPDDVAEFDTKETAWAAIQIGLGTPLGHHISVLSYLLVGRRSDGDEMVLLVQRKPGLINRYSIRVLSTSYEGDPKHAEIMCSEALKEFPRLQPILTEMLKAN